MHAVAWILAFLALDFALLVNAGLFFITPSDGSTCTGGTPCTLQWLDDGIAPLLDEIGVVTAGLYTGKQQLVQTIKPVDVSSVHSVQFTPNALAGPNSGSYYIAFTSTSANVNGTTYSGFSPFFNLKGMSGSFASPLAAATSTIAIPTSLTRTSSRTSGATITIGSVDTSLPSLSIPTPKSSSSRPISSQFTISSIPPPSSSVVSSSPSVTESSPSAIPTSGAAASLPTNLLSLPVLALLSLCVLWLSSIS